MIIIFCGKTFFFYFEYPICSLRTAAVDRCQSLESLFKTPKKEYVISYLYIKFSNFHLEYPIFLCTSLLLMQRSSLRLSSYIFVGNKISTPSTNLSSYLKKSGQKKQQIFMREKKRSSDRIFSSFFTLFLV